MEGSINIVQKIMRGELLIIENLLIQIFFIL